MRNWHLPRHLPTVRLLTYGPLWRRERAHAAQREITPAVSGYQPDCRLQASREWLLKCVNRREHPGSPGVKKERTLRWNHTRCIYYAVSGLGRVWDDSSRLKVSPGNEFSFGCGLPGVTSERTGITSKLMTRNCHVRGCVIIELGNHILRRPVKRELFQHSLQTNAMLPTCFRSGHICAATAGS